MPKFVHISIKILAVLVVATSSLVAASASAAALPSWMEFWKDDPYEFNGGFYEPPRDGIVLKDAVDHNGNPFSLQDHEGKVIFMYFGYTWCPDACPATLAEWREVKHVLGDDADNVVWVMITVDPERDTPERLKEWMAFWDEDFVGVTMSPEDTEEVLLKYGIQANKRESTSSSGYLVDHDTATYVMDPEGNLRLTYPLGFDPNDISEDIKHLQDGD